MLRVIFINLLSISENLNDLKELVHLLEEIGLSVNIMPRYSGIEILAKLMMP